MPFEKNNYLLPAYKLPADFKAPNYNDLTHDYEHPNLNSLNYRNVVSKYEPPTDFLRFYTSLDCNEEGLFMLASNNFNTKVNDCLIAGTYDFNDFVESRLSNVQLKETFESNISLVKYLTDTQFYAVTTNSKFMMYTTKPTSRDFHLLRTAEVRTKSNIKCLDRLTGSKQVIVGTSKGHLQIFNYESNLDLDSQIIMAHTDEVTGISSHPSKDKCWVTSSSDHSCVLWDKKLSRYASMLLKGHRDRVTDVKWLSENLILASDSSGSVFTMDPRNPKAAVNKQKVADRSIKALTFSKNLKTFGVISESPVFKIYKIDTDGQLKLVHEHSARPHVLYSMAWDAKDENSCYVVGDKKYAKKITFEN